MAGFIAFVVSAAIAYLPHLILGSRIDLMTDFLLGTFFGGIAYVATFYQIKKWQQGL